MKIKLEDYIKLKAQLDAFIALAGIEDVRQYRAKKLGNDIEQRFRWDILNFSGIKITELYSYLNDTHIDTALKHYFSKREDIKV